MDVELEGKLRQISKCLELAQHTTNQGRRVQKAGGGRGGEGGRGRGLNKDNESEARSHESQPHPYWPVGQSMLTSRTNYSNRNSWTLRSVLMSRVLGGTKQPQPKKVTAVQLSVKSRHTSHCDYQTLQPGPVTQLILTVGGTGEAGDPEHPALRGLRFLLWERRVLKQRDSDRRIQRGKERGKKRRWRSGKEQGRVEAKGRKRGGNCRLGFQR